MRDHFRLTAAAAIACLAWGGCASSPTAKPSSATVGSPMSNYCASSNSCPGLSKKKFEVCGSCDPATRYFRHAMCSLDEKVRKAIDSCVQGKVGVEIKGKDIFGGNVAGCVKQRLENEPQMVAAFTAIAKRHKATESEQAAWREQCDRLWAQHRGVKYVRTVNTPAKTARALKVATYNAALLAKARPAKAASGGGTVSGSGKVSGSGGGAAKKSGGAPKESYAELVNKGNALKKAGQFADAIAKYVEAMAQQQTLCQKSKRPAKLEQLGRDAPCSRAMRILFNVAITRRDAGEHKKAAAAFGSYLIQWRTWFPSAKFHPLEERARYEMARALFRLGKHGGALTQLRVALARWQAHHPKTRARFTDDAVRSVAICLEKLGRKRDAAAAYKAFLDGYKRAHGRDHADAKQILAKIKALK